MKRIPGIFALILCLGSSSLFAEGAPRPSSKTIYHDNPFVSVGALRLDVTKDVEAQVPAGWRHADAAPDPYRLVKFSGPVGGNQRELLAAAGYTVVSYHPFNSFLVRPQQSRPVATLASLEGVSWTGAFHPYFKLADVLAEAVAAGDASPFVVAESDWGLRFNIRLHEGDSRLRVEPSIASAPGVVTVFPTRTLPVRVQVAPESFAAFLQRVAALPEVVAIEPWLPRKLHNDENVQVGQAGACVNNGNEAPNAPVFANGITGWNSRLVVADSCTDSNEGWWYDDALARLPAHETTYPWNSSEPDWAQRKMIEYYDMYSGDTTMGCAGGDQHGTHVAGIVTGNCSLNPEGIATRTTAGNSDGDQDGMAPGSKIIPQDLGNGSLAYLNADGGYLGELYSVAFENTCDGADCGIDAHNNSWGADFNTYDYDAYSGDEALWRLQRGVIVTSAGNAGSNYNTIGTPATGKNVIAVGNATNCNLDILSGSSSRGKTSDGRIKPDVVAGGSQVTSAVNDGNGTTNSNGGCGTFTTGGTSMSSPTVAGYAGLVVQYFTDGFYPTGAANAFDWLEPSGPLLKAMLINTSQRMTEPTTAERNNVGWPNMDQGWGIVVLDNSLQFTGDSRKLWIHDETAGVDTSGTSSMTFRREVVGSDEPLKVTLVWYDPGHAGSCGGGTPCLENDLDLTVTEEGPGTVWTTTLVTGVAGHVVPRTVVPFPPVDKGQTSVDNGPDTLNTVEQIIIYNTNAGRTYSFTVTAANTPSGSVPFALVVTGDLADPCDAPTGAPAITAVDIDSCSNGGVQVSWSQDPAAWNDGDSGTRSYRVIRDGLPISAGGCAGNLGYGTTSCIDSEGPDNFSADYRVEYVSGCGTTVRTAEAAATDGVDFFVDVLPNGSSVCPGDSIVLTTEIEPAGTYTYQWTEDGVDMAGETSSTLTVTKGAVTSHSYNCRVTDPSSCANIDQVPVIGSWIDDPPDVEFNPASVPQNTLDEICGDGDGDVEPGEIWGLDVGLINRSACTVASEVTADLEINQSAVNAEICNPNGEFGALDPLVGGTDGFAFKVDEAGSCPNSMTFDVSNINWSGGGGNFDSGAFAVTVTGACNVTTTCSCSTIALDEVSGSGAATPLTVTRSGSLVNLSFAKNGATNYNVYVSTEASTQPFQVGSAGAGKKDCGVPWNSQLGGKALIPDYDVETGISGGSGVYYILVTGDDGPSTEASLGVTSEGTGRSADSYCAD